MANITAPQVNINGTGWQDLLDQHIAVVEHLTAAMNVLGQAAPHGRGFPRRGHVCPREGAVQGAARGACDADPRLHAAGGRHWRSGKEKLT
jgi:hypothetical protein